MISILCYFLLQLIALYGIGLLWHRVAQIKSANIGEVGFFGIITVTAVSAIWSLFFPMIYLSYLVCGVGWASVIMLPKAKLSIFTVMLFLAFIFPIYISVPQYDTGLYHLGVIIWERTYPLVFGLANFHSRFGFNSLWLTYAGGMTLGPSWIVSAMLVNASLLYFFFHFLWDIFRKHTSSVVDYSLIGLALFLAIQLYQPYDLGGPSTDLPSQLFGIIGLYYFFSYFSTKKTVLLEKSIAFVIFSVLYKFSNFGVAIIPITYGLFILRGKALHSAYIITAVLAGILWLIRNLILSGCLLGVVTAICLPVSWSARTQMSSAAGWVQSWARHPGLSPEVVLADYSWFTQYWLSYIWDRPLIKIMTVLVVLVVLFFVFKRKVNAEYNEGLRWILASLLMFFAIWFIGAPDYRFASFFIAFTISLLSAILFYPVIYRLRLLIKPTLVFVLLILLGISISKTIKFHTQLSDPWPRYTTPASTRLDLNDLDIDIRGSLAGDQCFDIPYCTPEYDKSMRITKVGGRLFITRE